MSMNKEILQQVLLEIVYIMERKAWVEAMNEPIDPPKLKSKLSFN